MRTCLWVNFSCRMAAPNLAVPCKILIMLLKSMAGSFVARMVNHLNVSLPEKFLLLSMKIIKGEYYYQEGAEFLCVKKFSGEIADNRAIITTHSPYILGEFNNLLYANEIQDVDEKRNEIVDEEKILRKSLQRPASANIVSQDRRFVSIKKEVPVEPSTSDFKNYLKSSRRASTACLCMSGRT